ncbi:hypothetical protein KCP73_03765 [Salmonella enterica subsp. enterica]|nr:hypothetical protein KCP73_03765 [Salmonella enterica subsp. enterica]
MRIKKKENVPDGEGCVAIGYHLLNWHDLKSRVCRSRYLTRTGGYHAVDVRTVGGTSQPTVRIWRKDRGEPPDECLLK